MNKYSSEIPFNIDLLPDFQTCGSLADLPPETQEQIEEDKQRWRIATETFNAGTARKMLKATPEGELKEDMRRRLNTIKTNRIRKSRTA